MHHFYKAAALSAAMLIGIAITASADPARPSDGAAAGTQIAALSSGNDTANSITLPGVTVHPPAPATSFDPRASSTHTVTVPHFKVWAGYDAAVGLHPYTSHVGPCPEGSLGTGCDRPQGTVIQPSRYERAPFSD